MDQALRALFRPRHLLVTLAIALVVGGGAGSLVGVARAQDPVTVAETVPPPFGFQSPWAGDRGRYDLVPAALSEEALRAGFEAERAYTFTFLMGGLEVQYDEAGQAHWARRVDTSLFEQRGDWNRTTTMTSWVADGSVIATMSESTDAPQVSQDPGGIIPGSDGQTVSQTTWRHLAFASWGTELPCGLLHDLQGQQAPPAGTVLATKASCAWGPNPLDPNAHWDVVQGLNESGFLRIDHVTTNPVDRPDERSRADWSAFHRADIPYPAEVRNGWSAFGAPGDILRLVAFERGPAEPLVELGPLPAPLPTPETVQRTPWVLDDTGVDHPFPLSTAIEHVAADPSHPGLRDYLAQHPEAYVQWARHAEFDMDGTHSHRWTFEYVDGTTRHQEVVSRSEARSTVLVPGVALPVPATTYSYEEANHLAPYGDWPILPAADLPDVTPRVASLLAVWQAMPQLSGNPNATSSWEFQVGCPTWVDSCEEAILMVSAGQQYYYRISEPGYPVQDNRLDVWDTSALSWSNGELVGGIESDQVHQRSEEPIIASPTPPPETASQALGPAPTPFWIAPTPGQAAGIGLGAVLVAGLYWLWPLVKGGGVGLFSRVHKDRLLDNPLRQQLVQRIEAEPGIHHNALVRDLGKGKGAAEHHLDKLVESRLVLRHRGTGYTCYFPMGTDRRDMAAAPVVKSEGARQVLEALRNGVPGVRGIAIATGLSPSTVSHHLERLRAAGLVVGDGHTGYHVVHGGSPTAAAGA